MWEFYGMGFVAYAFDFIAIKVMEAIIKILFIR